MVEAIATGGLRRYTSSATMIDGGFEGQLMIVGLPGGRRAKLYASSGTGATPFPDEYDVPSAIVADREHPGAGGYAL